LLASSLATVMYYVYTPVARSSPPRRETKILESIGANLRELIRDGYTYDINLTFLQVAFAASDNASQFHLNDILI